MFDGRPATPASAGASDGDEGVRSASAEDGACGTGTDDGDEDVSSGDGDGACDAGADDDGSEGEASATGLAAVRRRYALVCVGTTVRIVDMGKRPKLVALSVPDFAVLARIRYGVSRKAWNKKDGLPTFDDVVFEPAGCEPKSLNLWTGWRLAPSPGSWERFHAHLLHVVCCGDAETLAYVLNWLAAAVQRPGQPVGTMLVLRGAQGCGKSIVAAYLSRIFTDYYTAVTQRRHITGQFNAHLAHTLLLFADEAFFAGDHETASVLKGLITESRRVSEGKYRDFGVRQRQSCTLALPNTDARTHLRKTVGPKHHHSV